MRKFKLLFSCLLFTSLLQAQETFPVNGITDKRDGCFAFTNATIVKDAQTTITNATLVIREGKIVAVGAGVAIPKDATVIDCKDKFIYPSFIDIYTDYGIPQPQRAQGPGLTNPQDFFRAQQSQSIASSQKGAYGWNMALKADVDAVRMFSVDEARAKPYREGGFGAVLTHQKDGIVRGTGSLVSLANEKDNLVIIKEKASANYSFSKGTSTQSYPSSMMGNIALLRQTYLDAAWYKSNPAAAKEEGVNLTLKNFNENQSLPQIFDAQDRGTDLWNVMRADRIGDEAGVQYIIKATGKEYQRIKDVAATKAPLIVNVNFAQAQDVEDPNDARLVSLADMKAWELAPTNPARIEKAGIAFCLTAADLRDPKTFLTNVRKAIEYGLTEKGAMDALTKNPATWLGVYDKVGSIDAGKIANFVITTGPIFLEKSTILQNWIQGSKYAVKEDAWYSIAGTYNLEVSGTTGTQAYILDVKSNSQANVIGKDTIAAKFSFDGKTVKIGYAPGQRRRTPPAGFGGGIPGGIPGGGAGGFGGAAATVTLPVNATRLTGYSNGTTWNGTGVDSTGYPVTWSVSLVSLTTAKTDSVKLKPIPKTGGSFYPFTAFGNSDSTLPTQETVLFKNATVWTSDKAGIIEGGDVLVKNGKIVKVGKGLSDGSARVIDATGKHLTAGLIDEHSHIASASTNEGGQSVTSEVRIQDNLDPDDINIYRQLSGGVTTSHILHGSANTIGGQTQLIKLRWGVNDEELKFKGADPFIKFALGENVKRASSQQGNTRFPDTRMGVEQVLTDAFNRAKAYDDARKAAGGTAVRKDLELEALAEIMNKKRFITCHSYIASEILTTMRVAEKFGFRINTFTHILEGYKVADRMKEHGAAASTFSDWWAYKNEVQDAIPYNAAIMTKVGLNVAINSDDAEMARRLNQEAAKSVKYGGLTEEEALKMVTINPAKMLHVDDKVGSIKEGKDADLVLWSDNPLSIYAKSLYTMVDGIIYFDREKDVAMRKQVKAERTRLIGKMVGEKRSGAPITPFTPSFKYISTCLDHGHKLGMLEIDLEDLELNQANH